MNGVSEHPLAKMLVSFDEPETLAVAVLPSRQVLGFELGNTVDPHLVHLFEQCLGPLLSPPEKGGLDGLLCSVVKRWSSITN